MESYKIIKKGSSIQHCIKIPKEFLDMNLEITIRPYLEKRKYRKKMVALFSKYKDVKPFDKIADSMEWQRGVRNEWEKRPL